MANIQVGGRAYITTDQEYAYKQRTMLGIESSAVVLSDTGVRKGFAGLQATQVLIDPNTKTNELNEQIDIPTDFREVGLSIMNQIGIPIETQTLMFNNFIANYTKEQRTTFVDSYDVLDKNDATAVHDFVNQMIALLS